MPYGYLVVDLKPFTPDHLRLRTDVLDRRAPIRGEQPAVERHLPVDNQSDRTCSEPTKQQEMPSCDDCGIIFDTMHDVQRHVKRWCPENGKRKDDVEI